MTTAEKSPFVAEVEKAFGVLNNGLFSGKLNLPVVLLAPSRQALFRFTGDPYHLEIGSRLKDVTLEEVFSGLLHEMIHIRNFVRGVVDCSSNLYHNHEFLKEALRVGFYVLKDRNHGAGITLFSSPRDLSEEDREKRLVSPTGEAVVQRKKVVELIDFDLKAFRRGKREMDSLVIPSANKKQYFLKYQCDCPKRHNSMRTGRRPDGANAPLFICLRCGGLLRCVEPGFKDTDEKFVVSPEVRQRILQLLKEEGEDYGQRRGIDEGAVEE